MTTSIAETLETLGEMPSAPSIREHTDRSFFPLAGQEGYSIAVCFLPNRQLRSEISKVTEQIRKEYPDHHPVPESFLHMTVAILGGVATRGEVDEFYQEHKNELRRRIDDIGRPFQILVKSVNHFPNCCFAQVSDESEADVLERLHTSLIGLSGTPYHSFAPHITMLHNNAKVDPYTRDRYIDRALSGHNFGVYTVDTLHLTALDTQRSMYDDPLKIIGTYPLGSIT